MLTFTPPDVEQSSLDSPSFRFLEGQAGPGSLQVGHVQSSPHATGPDDVTFSPVNLSEDEDFQGAAALLLQPPPGNAQDAEAKALPQRGTQADGNHAMPPPYQRSEAYRRRISEISTQLAPNNTTP